MIPPIPTTIFNSEVGFLISLLPFRTPVFFIIGSASSVEAASSEKQLSGKDTRNGTVRGTNTDG